ncbi:S8 family serine peptidase [Phenylobacterium sp.]|uniref:S8 family serine peptidase n=1 Tax=Phenylobacterium sp. TaxID=1871053 RepID=UPI002733677B|nr:S8 family serine peptidase [Phenylobacterium sp.]MDP3852894.1 S8 family serine peptidase [Phenylobacterium sp.]
MTARQTPARNTATRQRRNRPWLAGALAAMAFWGPAHGQIIGGSGGLALPAPSLPSAGLPDISGVRTPRLPQTQGAASAVRGLTTQALTQARRLKLDTLVRDNPTLLEFDERGAAVVRGEVLALSPSPEALARLQAAGFKAGRSLEAGGLDIGVTVLELPAGLSAREAVALARRLDPAGQYDFNHLYSDAGGDGAAQASPGPARAPLGAVRVGLIDSGVDTGHPALRGVRIEQRGFAPGGVRPQGHGLATASLLVGRQGRFRGAAPGSGLYVADVYGTTPVGGSAASLVQGLAWMAQARVPVINVSLVGPPNLTLQAAVRTLNARGHLIVAAVGNDGPAAPPLYPAAYPGVIAVTAVDGRRRVLPEAGRPGRIDFTAPGADMAVPAVRGGFVAVRGTSFAAPLVAGSLAGLLPTPDPQGAARAVSTLARQALDLGPRGPDAIFGLGLVGFDLVSPPRAVAAKGMLTSR